MLHFHKNLKLIRKLMGKTQIEIAAEFDLTEAKIKSYEGNRAKPDVLFLSRLSSATGIPVEDLKDKLLTEKDISGEKEQKVKLKGPKISAEKALLVALLKDYASLKGKLENVSPDDVVKDIENKADLILYALK